MPDKTESVERRFTGSDIVAVRMTPMMGEDGVPMPDRKRIEGYAAVFYNGDPRTQYVLETDKKGEPRAVERIMPGAFDNDVLQHQGNDVVATFNHNMDNVLGRVTAGTLRMAIDRTGCRYEIDPPDTQCAKDVQALIARGDVRGSSFGFTVQSGGERWSKDGKCDVRELTKLRLHDVGPVTQPAYEGASVGLRAEDAAGALESRAAWEAEQQRQAKARAAACQARARAAEVAAKLAKR